jgi:hypothetical protein
MMLTETSIARLVSRFHFENAVRIMWLVIWYMSSNSIIISYYKTDKFIGYRLHEERKKIYCCSKALKSRKSRLDRTDWVINLWELQLEFSPLVYCWMGINFINIKLRCSFYREHSYKRDSMKQLHISPHRKIWNQSLLSRITTNFDGAWLSVTTNLKNQNMVHITSKFLS